MALNPVYPTTPGYVDLQANCTLVQNVAAMSLCAWVNITNFPGSGETYISHFSTNGVASVSRFGLSINQPTSGFRATCRRLDADALVALNDTTVLSTGTWYHVALVADFTNALLTFYVNGATTVATAPAGWTGNTSNTASTRGCHLARATQLLQIDGTVEDIKMWSRALTANEIENEYGARGRSINLPSMVNRHLFSGQSGTTATGTSIDLTKTVDGIFTDGPLYIDGAPISWRKQVNR